MVSKSDLSVHETWQEAAGIAFGALAALSPLLTGDGQATQAAQLSAAAGAIFMVISGAHLLSLSRITQFVKVLCGLLLTAGPFLFGYAGTSLAFIQHFIGPTLLALAALELWQDWSLSDDQLERYGSVQPRYTKLQHAK